MSLITIIQQHTWTCDRGKTSTAVLSLLISPKSVLRERVANGRDYTLKLLCERSTRSTSIALGQRLLPITYPAWLGLFATKVRTTPLSRPRRQERRYVYEILREEARGILPSIIRNIARRAIALDRSRNKNQIRPYFVTSRPYLNGERGGVGRSL